MIAYEHVIGKFREQGLNVKELGSGKASAQAPGHSASDLSVTITDNGFDRVLVHSHAGEDLADVLSAVGLSTTDLFNDPGGSTYAYPDGRQVHRSPAKRFRQSGNTKGSKLYRTDLDDDVVYLVEGENDVHALETLGVAATCTAMGAGKAHLADLSPLHGKTVVVVRDKDEAGRRHADQVAALLDGVATVALVEAKAGKDAADHVAAGLGVDEFLPVDDPGAPERSVPRKLVPTLASDVKIKRVRWTFENWIVLGALNLLAGREGLGKSTLAVWIAAKVTQGTLPGELFGKPRHVIYLATEDDPAFTVAPRLKAAGADLDRVLFLSVHTETSTEGVVSLPSDMAELERVIAEHDVALVVLDAATSVMDAKLDGHDDRKVRQFLEPLAQSAGRMDYSVLGICHFGKRDGVDTGKLILGSVAWSQVARSVLAVALNDEAGDLVITNTKKNLAPDTKSAAARVVSQAVVTDDGDTEVGRIEWLGETDVDARDLLEGGDENGDRADWSEAENWLFDYLTQEGRASAKKLKADALAVGIKDHSVKRAARKLKVVYSDEGFPRTSVWSLPVLEQSTPVHVPTVPTVPTEVDLQEHIVPTDSLLEQPLLQSEQSEQWEQSELHGPTGVPTALASSGRTNVWLGSGEPIQSLCPDCSAPLGKTGRCVPCILADVS